MARIQQLCPEAAQWPVGDYSGYDVLLAFTAGEAVGFCAWRRVAPDECELLNLGVRPEWRGKGVASALLKRLCTEAAADIFLEVAETNAPAIALYEKSGWNRTGTREGYYQNGRVNAVVMKKTSC